MAAPTLLRLNIYVIPHDKRPLFLQNLVPGGAPNPEPHWALVLADASSKAILIERNATEVNFCVYSGGVVGAWSFNNGDAFPWNLHPAEPAPPPGQAAEPAPPPGQAYLAALDAAILASRARAPNVLDAGGAATVVILGPGQMAMYRTYDNAWQDIRTYMAGVNGGDWTQAVVDAQEA